MRVVDIKLGVRDNVGAERTGLDGPARDLAGIFAVGELVGHIDEIAVSVKLVDVASFRIRGVIVVVIPRNTQGQPSTGSGRDCGATDKVIEPQIRIGRIAVLGVDVAHGLRGELRIELGSVVIGLELERRTVIAPDERVRVVRIRIHHDAVARIRVVIVTDGLVGNPHGVLDTDFVILIPLISGAAGILTVKAARLVALVLVIGEIILRLERDRTSRLVLIGRSCISNLNLQIRSTSKIAEFLIVNNRDALDKLTVRIFIKIELEVIGIRDIL